MKKNNGFTLLEILIALSVFAILATITSSAMYHAFNTRALVTKQADRLSTLQLAMALIQRDTQQITQRSVRGNQLHLFPAFTGQSQYLEFTRGGAVNPDGSVLRSTLMRIAFLCRNGQLVRRSWEALDTPYRNKYQDKVLLNNLDQCKFAYLMHNHQVLSEWHENALRENQRKESLPTAIQFTFNLTDWGNMSLLFVIPEALYAE
jgi:general secretion pathway protein J